MTNTLSHFTVTNKVTIKELKT
uniref:Uncharacterized protein n=1 Tax=Rhizophora mucronata TaxID=61149 RepID=A0A2P2NSL6_RHIMU